jgi:hypothetical protein
MVLVVCLEKEVSILFFFSELLTFEFVNDIFIIAIVVEDKSNSIKGSLVL